MTRFYLDTSVAVHALRGTPQAESWFDDVAASGEDTLVSSRLLQTELTRVLRRDALPVQHREDLLQSVAQTPVTEAILTAAESIADHVKTLDAIHLATAMAFGSDTVVVTHDDNVARVGLLLGLRCFDPLVEPDG